MEVLNGLEQSVAAVFGDTSSEARANILSSFKEGAIKYLVNVNVLTTGFDAPNIDGVVLLRPTASPGLLYQMVGRGFRINEGKEDCLVLDYGNNILRHGPIDAIRVRAEKKRKKSDLSKEDAPAKECSECRSLVAIHYTSCPECGHEFPRQERSPNHSSQASDEAVLSTEDVSSVDYEVEGIRFRPHSKKKGVDENGAYIYSTSMKVEYEIGWNTYVSEWICFEHEGYARKKAEGWWKVRSNEPVPSTIEEAIELCRFGAIKKTVGIIVDEREEYPRILSYLFGGFPTQEEIDKQLSA
jgi:DNA repair protein RadD